MSRCFLLVYVVGLGWNVLAHDVISTKITWTREVSRIIYSNCASCHRDGGSAFSLMTYDQARPWAKAIKEEVLSRRMPPWNAVKGFGEFKNDAGLTQEQMETIADWVEGGAPEGDPALLPTIPRLSAPEVPAATAAGSLNVAGTLRLSRPLEFSAIQTGQLPPGASVQVTAVFPDGSVEPLLWVENFNPAFDQPYYFAKPLKLPSGSRIDVSPANAPSIKLLRLSSGAR